MQVPFLANDIPQELHADASYREAWVEVDLGKIAHNINIALKESSVKGFFAVVKANAYGHGDIAVSSVALLSGAKKLCVATLDEGLRLRQAFPNAPIMILGAVSLEYLAIAADNNLEITIFDIHFARALRSFKGGSLKAHLKINTGMNRLGLRGQSDILEADEILSSNICLMKEGVFTHYHSADSNDKSHTEEQVQRFSSLLELLNVKSYSFLHASNSAGMAFVNQCENSEHGRLGILMYGINPNPNIGTHLRFEPAFALKAKVVHIKKISEGESVGYSRGYVANKSTLIAVLPVGYADGFWRYNEGKVVSINNRFYTIVGRISMDQCMIEIDDKVKVGDIATLYGNEISINGRAKELATIPYELVCAISNRIPRRYVNRSAPSESTK